MKKNIFIFLIVSSLSTLLLEAQKLKNESLVIHRISDEDLKERISILEDYQKIINLARIYDEYSRKFKSKFISTMSEEKSMEALRKATINYAEKLDEFFSDLYGEND